MKYTYRIFEMKHLGFFVEEMIGNIATCDHAVSELKDFNAFYYEENELTEYAESAIRTYNYVLKNHTELLL
jgi:hypothetical protein